jgi:hypothetical protein
VLALEAGVAGCESVMANSSFFDRVVGVWGVSAPAGAVWDGQVGVTVWRSAKYPTAARHCALEAGVATIVGAIRSST